MDCVCVNVANQQIIFSNIFWKIGCCPVTPCQKSETTPKPLRAFFLIVIFLNCTFVVYKSVLFLFKRRNKNDAFFWRNQLIAVQFIISLNLSEIRLN